MGEHFEDVAERIRDRFADRAPRVVTVTVEARAWDVLVKMEGNGRKTEFHVDLFMSWTTSEHQLMAQAEFLYAHGLCILYDIDNSGPAGPPRIRKITDPELVDDIRGRLAAAFGLPRHILFPDEVKP